MKIHTRGTIYTILSAIAFGLMPLFAIQVYQNGGNAIFLTFLRFLFSLPLLWILSRSDGKQKKEGFNWKFFSITAAFILTPLLLFLSYTYIDSSLSTTLHFTYPALVLIICRIFFRQPVTAGKYLCCGLCLIGVVFFCSAGQSDGAIHLTGIFLAFASAITYAFYTSCLIPSGVQKQFSPFRLTFCMNLCGACMMAVLNTCMGTWALSMSAAGWIYSLLLSWGTAVGATLLYQTGVNLCGPQNAAMFSTLEPVTSVIMGVLFLEEVMTRQTVIGITLILISVFLLSFQEHFKSN